MHVAWRLAQYSALCCLSCSHAQDVRVEPSMTERCHAGMRVIGVTTTLAQEKMRSEAPDTIRPDIGRISVEDLLSLRRARADTVHSSESVRKDRVASGQQASTSQNVSS